MVNDEVRLMLVLDSRVPLHQRNMIWKMMPNSYINEMLELLEIEWDVVNGSLKLSSKHKAINKII